MAEENPQTSEGIKFKLKEFLTQHRISITTLHKAMPEGTSLATLYSYVTDSESRARSTPQGENLAKIITALRLLSRENVNAGTLLDYTPPSFLKDNEYLENCLKESNYKEIIVKAPQIITSLEDGSKILGASSQNDSSFFTINQLQQGLIRNKLGRAQHLTGNYTDAEATYREAIENLKPAIYEKTLAKMGLATVLRERNPEAAKDEYQSVIFDIRSAFPNKNKEFSDEALKIEVQGLRGMGECYILMGNAIEALYHLELAQALISDKTDTDSRGLRAHINNDLGRTKNAMDMEQSLDFHREALTTYRKINAGLGQAFSKVYLSHAMIKYTRAQNAAQRASTFAEAESYLGEAEDFFETTGVFGGRMLAKFVSTIMTKLRLLSKADTLVIKAVSIEEGSNEVLNKRGVKEAIHILREMSNVTKTFHDHKINLNHGYSFDPKTATLNEINVPLVELNPTRPIALCCFEKGKARLERLQLFLKISNHLDLFKGQGNHHIDEDVFTNKFKQIESQCEKENSDENKKELLINSAYSIALEEALGRFEKSDGLTITFFSLLEYIEVEKAMVKDLKFAEESLKHASDIAKSINDKRTAHHALVWLVRINLVRLQLNRSLAIGDKAEFFEAIDRLIDEIEDELDQNKELIISDRNVGSLYYFKGLRILEELDDIKNSSPKAKIKNLINKATRSFHTTLGIFEKIDHPRMRAATYEALGRLNELQDDEGINKVSFNYYRLALEIYKKHQFDKIKQYNLEAKLLS